MTLVISQLYGEPALAEEPVSIERFDELIEANARLQLLVCELLAKNQRLRFQRMHDELVSAASLDETAR